MTQQHKVFLLRRNYYRLLNNLTGCIKKSIITDNERKIMELEVRRAKKQWEDAEGIL